METFIIITGLAVLAFIFVSIMLWLTFHDKRKCENCGGEMVVVHEDDRYITFICTECRTRKTFKKKLQW